uniref:ARAD1B01210p n=1 Tax=Blastobotrys adeninivorans TaxID=409370 RepID=A0A060TAK8_BLAAD
MLRRAAIRSLGWRWQSTAAVNFVRNTDKSAVDTAVGTETAETEAVEGRDKPWPSRWATMYVKDKRKFFAHIALMRSKGRHMKALSIGYRVLREHMDSASRPIFEEMLLCIGDMKQPSTLHGELALHLFEQSILRRQTRLSQPDQWLEEVLYGIMTRINNPVLVWKYSNAIDKHYAKARIDAKLVEHRLRLLLGVGEIEQLVDLLRESTALEVKLSGDICEVILVALLQLREMDFALEVMHYVYHSQYRTVFARSWGMFISYAAQERHYPSLKWAFKAAIIPGSIVLDDGTYKRIMDVASQNGGYKLVRWAFLRHCQRLEATGQVVNTSGTAMVPLIEAHVVARQLKPALELIDRLGHSASEVRLTDIPQFCRAVRNSKKKLRIVYKAYERARRDGAVSDSTKTLLFNIVLKGLSRRGRRAEAVRFYREAMKRLDVFPNEDTMFTIMSTAIVTRDKQLVTECLQACARYNIPLSRRMLEPLILFYSVVGRPQQALHLQKIMASKGIHRLPYLPPLEEYND